MTDIPDDIKEQASDGAKKWGLIGVVLAGMIACFIAAGAACAGTGCAPANSPMPPARYVAREVVLGASAAVTVGYETCATLVTQRGHDEDLRAKCHAALDGAAHAVEAAASGVDAWSSAADNGSIACALLPALNGLQSLSASLADYGVSVPPVVADAIDGLKSFAPACDAPDGGAE